MNLHIAVFLALGESLGMGGGLTGEGGRKENIITFSSLNGNSFLFLIPWELRAGASADVAISGRHHGMLGGISVKIVPHRAGSDRLISSISRSAVFQSDRRDKDEKQSRSINLSYLGEHSGPPFSVVPASRWTLRPQGHWPHWETPGSALGGLGVCNRMPGTSTLQTSACPTNPKIHKQCAIPDKHRTQPSFINKTPDIQRGKIQIILNINQLHCVPKEPEGPYSIHVFWIEVRAKVQKISHQHYLKIRT